VRVDDFQDKRLGKAIPYGVCDILNNQGGGSVGSTTTRPSSPPTASAAGGT
jgi:hypothetical protein